MPDGHNVQVVPLLKVAGCLLGSVQEGLHDRRALEMQAQVLVETVQLRPHAVILDFTAMPLVDSFLARVILDTAKALRLLGSRLLLCGLPNLVIVTMVELGIVVPLGTVMYDIDAALREVYGRSHNFY